MGLKPVVGLALLLANRTRTDDPDDSVESRRARDVDNVWRTRLLIGRPARVASVVERRVPVEGGEITVRVFTPFGAGPFPAHVYAHGGAFWLGTLDQYDPLCREYCAKGGCVVVSVDYRRAPEHRFPTQPEDCYAALVWTVDQAATLNVDPARVSVGGTSAGGSLMAAAALMSRDRGGPPIMFQLLEIPALDCTMSQPSIAEFGQGYLLTRPDMDRAIAYYLARPEQATDPYASPLLARSVAGLPPTRILTCEFDPLRDEGEAYGRRLIEAGVPTVVSRYDGHVHSSTYATRLLPSARRFVAESCSALREAYWGRAGQTRS